MLDLSRLVPVLKREVRFKQTVNPDIPELTTELVEPQTSRLIDHALLNNENLDAIVPDFDNWDVPDWTDTSFPTVGTKVRFNQNIYANNVAITAPADNPEINPDWDLVAGLSGFLEQKREEATRNVVTTVYNKKKNDRITKEMLDHLLIYNGVGRINDRIVKQDRIVGFEIRLLDAVNIKVILETIGLQLDTTQTSPLTLYLYHSSQVDPVAEFTLDYNKPGSVQWFDTSDDNVAPNDLDEVLKYEDFTEDKVIAGGAYYLVYYEEDLTGQAINYRYDFRGGVNCRSCSRYNKDQYLKWSQFAYIRPIQLASSAIEPGRTLFEINKIKDNIDTNWGLNLRLSTYCDLTDYFIRHPELFADAIARQLTTDLLRELANTTRNNLIAENIQDKARFALQDESLGGEGELKRLDHSLDALGFELSDIQESNCMPRIADKGAQVNEIGPAQPYLNYNRGYQGTKTDRRARLR